MKSSRKKSADHRTKPPSHGLISSPPRLNRRKSWLFRLGLAIGAPVAFLVLTELVLLLVGFGHPTGFLLTSQRDGQPVLIQNNQFGWRFFGAAMARMPEPICLPQ